MPTLKFANCSTLAPPLPDDPFWEATGALGDRREHWIKRLEETADQIYGACVA
jgi:hypothetical protein